MTIYKLRYEDLSFEKQQDILLDIKAEEFDKLKEEGAAELNLNGEAYNHFFIHNPQVEESDKWMVAVVQLYDFEVFDVNKWDRTVYLFVIEEFAEEKARERINKTFTTQEVTI